ncbi:MAG: hypothetical protein WAU84_22090, partial [Thermoguttaceae bacterium]
MLLRDDGLLIRSCLLQLTNPLLTDGQLIGKKGTVVLHALLNACRRDLVLLARRFSSEQQNRHHARRHRGRRRTLAKSMPSKISVKSLSRISIPAGDTDPSSRTALAA